MIILKHARRLVYSKIGRVRRHPAFSLRGRDGSFCVKFGVCLRRLAEMLGGSAMEDKSSVRISDFIDVKKMIAEHTVEELCQRAEDYFGRINYWDMMLAKPFHNLCDTIPLLIQFAHLLSGLHPYPNMTILDFGAGTGWASRYLNQLGFEVISLDVSHTALRKGEEMRTRYPVLGNQPEQRFLHFDGRKIDLANESVDRIWCIDAFHHVPNQLEVLKEMYRVLKPGGIAGFAEPGPNQSKDPCSQLEMKNYKVLENDIVLEEVFKQAQQVGFIDQKVDCYTTPTMPIPLEEWNVFLRDRAVFRKYVNAVHSRSLNFPIFFLYKGGEQIINDSRDAAGLVAKIEGGSCLSIKPFTEFDITLQITNISKKIWLPSGGKRGSVNIGAHLSRCNAGDSFEPKKEFRCHLSSANVMPGEAVHCRLQMPGLAPGNYSLEIDLVSEYVVWFRNNGSNLFCVEVTVD
jgi:SAM-dependent methyltransferase